ncbi:MAG: 2-dehydropantoate 2-reductase [Alphaproteobacteria bacterium]|nr:2-dehydropantoate 2-reductase [Alphaproteobacteria bacterium]
MKLCVFGAGAIGGYLAVKLAKAGVAVSLVARGPHLAAIRANGLTLRSEGETHSVRLPASDNPADLGPQDYVMVGLKAHQLPAAAPTMKPLLGEDTAIVAAMNGVPWWYFYGVAGPFRDARLKSIDPEGTVWENLHPRRAIGCIVYPAAEIAEPGVINHTYSNRFDLGEPDGTRSPRVEALSQAMIKAGLKAPIRPRIRDDLWVKLWGNLCFNPVSLLTGATLEAIATDPGTRAVCRAMMVEARAMAEKLGVTFAIDVDKRIAGAQGVGAHKTSMLQDLERGRPVELDALLGVVIEMARLVDHPVPMCEAVLALARQKAATAGVLPK